MIDLTTERSREIKHSIISAINDVWVRHGGDLNYHVETYDTLVCVDIWGKDGLHHSFDVNVDHEKTNTENYRVARHKMEQALKSVGMEFMTSEEMFCERVNMGIL